MWILHGQKSSSKNLPYALYPVLLVWYFLNLSSLFPYNIHKFSLVFSYLQIFIIVAIFGKLSYHQSSNLLINVSTLFFVHLALSYYCIEMAVFVWPLLFLNLNPLFLFSRWFFLKWCDTSDQLIIIFSVSTP